MSTHESSRIPNLSSDSSLAPVNPESKMDAPNKVVAELLFQGKEKEAITAMFTGDSGEKLSYSEMRARYG